MWQFEDYENETATREVAVFISERTRALALAALSLMDNRFAWQGARTDDTLWDTIEAARAQAYFELMEDVTNVNAPTPATINLYLNANQAIAANVAEEINWSGFTYRTPALWWIVSEPNSIVIPFDGVYSIMGNIQLGAAAITTGAKQVLLKQNGITVYHTQTQSGAPGLAIACALNCQEADIFTVEILTSIALNVTGDATGYTQISFVREHTT